MNKAGVPYLQYVREVPLNNTHIHRFTEICTYFDKRVGGSEQVVPNNYHGTDQVIMSILQIQYCSNDQVIMNILQIQNSKNDQVIMSSLKLQHKTQ